MFNDTPEIQVVKFTPAYSHQKCGTVFPLALNILTLLAICFAPAYMNTLVDALGSWVLWAWMGTIAAAVAVGAILTPWPAYDTYIVKADESALGAYQDKFDITYRKRSNTWRLESTV